MSCHSETFKNVVSHVKAKAYKRCPKVDCIVEINPKPNPLKLLLEVQTVALKNSRVKISQVIILLYTIQLVT